MKLLAYGARAFSAYGAALASRPILVQSVTAAVIAGAGDVVCQARARGDADVVCQACARGDAEPSPRSRAPRAGRGWEAARTARMAAWALAVTPVVSKWFSWLGRAFPTSSLQRMLADQLLFTPLNICAFLFTMGLAETGTAGGGMRKLQAMPSVLRSNYVVWPAVQWLNFSFVPPLLQPLAVNVVGLAWAVYLSAVVNS
jgi:protein Mpv17